MTEGEWLAAADPTPLLEFVRARADERRLRLFAVACCRGVWHRLSDWRCRRAVEVAERYADGGATREEMAAARADIRNERRFGSAAVAKQVAGHPAGHAAACTLHMLRCLVAFSSDKARPLSVSDVRLAGEAAGLRCIFGNPFRPITLDPSWLTTTVVALAKEVYESRDFAAMPILADALQDEGFTDEAILSHCRGAGPHARGCHVIDAILGKS